MKFRLRKLNEVIPFIDTLKTYKFSLFRWDLIAGITLASFVLPESMAYASLAGVPTQLGIYGCMAGSLLFALFSQSKQIAVGPTSAISLMVGTSVAVLSGGDMDRWVAIASLTALTMFVLCVISYALRLSGLMSFISDSILTGFKTGAALSIASTQLPKLFGIHGNGGNFFMRLYSLFEHISETNMDILLFGSAMLALLLVANHFLPGRPVVLGVVILSMVLCKVMNLEARGFEVVPPIPEGLPHFGRPSLRFADVDGILGLALGCFLMAYIETIAVAKTFADKYDYSINPRQELLSLGAANLSSAFASGYPVSGGMSQSTVNDKAGAKTQMALVFCSMGLAAVLLFFTGLFKSLPEVMLAVVVLDAITSLVKIKEIKRIYTLNKFEFGIAILAIVSVLSFGILKGVLIAALSSILVLLAQTSRPNVAVLGRIPGTRRYSDIARHSDNEEIPGIKIFRVESSILYFNQEHVYDSLTGLLKRGTTKTKLVILDMSASPKLDIEGSKMIKKFVTDVEAAGMQFKMVEALSELRDLLRKQELEDQIGRITRRESIEDVVEEFLRRK